jgi:hypothetical protein
MDYSRGFDFSNLVRSALRVAVLSVLALCPLQTPLKAQDATASTTAQPAKSSIPFDMTLLEKAPETFPSEDITADGVKSLFFKGLDYKGKQTRIFAYYGAPPSTAEPRTEKLPAMVLIHGGGGTAFDRWVKLWN